MKGFKGQNQQLKLDLEGNWQIMQLAEPRYNIYSSGGVLYQLKLPNPFQWQPHALQQSIWEVSYV